MSEIDFKAIFVIYVVEFIIFFSLKFRKYRL